MEIKHRIFFLVIIFVGIYLVLNKPEYSGPTIPEENKTFFECVTDSDCGIGGCSGEVCTTAERSKDIFTSCIFKSEYECFKRTTCRCISNKCSWEEDEEYKLCIESKGK